MKHCLWKSPSCLKGKRAEKSMAKAFEIEGLVLLELAVNNDVEDEVHPTCMERITEVLQVGGRAEVPSGEQWCTYCGGG
jgi:hypothetical protein